ncbi:MAG: hypothetical protein GXP47_13755 [Acidobacteria bacterium]|nr:hypothetical protein [Acidobacteriota bacterium]
MLRRTCLALAVLAATTAWAAPPTVAELLQRVPADARAVVAVDTAALRTEPLVQRWLLEHQTEWSGVDDEATRFLDDAGIDPAADVDAFVFAMFTDEADGHPLALVGGRFDAASLTAAVVARGAEPQQVAGVTVYRVDQNAGAAHAALVRITDDLLVFGDRAALTASLGRGVGPVPIVEEEAAAGHLDLEAPFWVVSDLPERNTARTPPQAAGSESPEDQAMLAVLAASSMVRRVAGWARLDEELAVHGFATTTSDENAGLLRDTIRGALAAARLAVQEKEPLLVDVLRGVRVDADGAVVSLAATIPVELLQKLAAEPHVRAGRAQRATPR